VIKGTVQAVPFLFAALQTNPTRLIKGHVRAWKAHDEQCTSCHGAQRETRATMRTCPTCCNRGRATAGAAARHQL